MDTIQPSHKRWVAKHNVGMCGVNKWRYLWKWHHSPIFLQCKEPETAQHIYLCAHKSIKQFWNLELVSLDQWLDDANTEPTLHAAILAGLRALKNPRLQPDRNDISEKQQQIGWVQFFEGKLHIDWSKQQQQYFTESNSRRSGQRWCSQLIQALWAMRRRLWKQRNDREHDSDSVTRMQDLSTQILAIIEQGFNTVPRRNRNLHTPQAIRRVIASTDPEYKRSWIRNINAAKAFATANIARQADASQRTLHRFFPTNQSQVILVNNTNTMRANAQGPPPQQITLYLPRTSSHAFLSASFYLDQLRMDTYHLAHHLIQQVQGVVGPSPAYYKHRHDTLGITSIVTSCKHHFGTLPSPSKTSLPTFSATNIYPYKERQRGNQY